ncbi:hypothetical protein A7E78_11215 [Syntrophotalea acetylenivorans]|uniref:Methyltransferase n=1 Tax=Syntrophotalea acetylenivorans TaxID=1842532 RepID=A0A1L3GQZ8_9BACT|nr:hypothetical protein A7E78_11215 [Syntrophotalea acetylenivorans]
MICPLCENKRTLPFWRDQRRSYMRCDRCFLVFVPTEYHLSLAAEKAEYDLHRNDPGDPGYRKFLQRLFEPLRERLTAGAKGLDFGSGPGPTLAPMFAEAGFDMAIYDPFYAPDRSVLQNRYDFISCSEVLEHFHAPGRELQFLWELLAVEGWLGVMTKLVIDQQAFSRWHYKNDPTHVAFFSRETFVYLARKLNARLELIAPDVILLQKTS